MTTTKKTLTTALAIHLLAGFASASALLNEVLYDADGSDAPGVFTEILATPGLDLGGWTLVGVNGSSGSDYRSIHLTGAVVPDDGLFVVATSSAAPGLAAVRDFIANVDWQNGPDAVQLRNAAGDVVDALQYGDAGAGNSGEGFPAEDVVAGLSLQRIWGAVDTDDNAIDFLALAPTPGVVPSPTPPPSPVPTPSTFALLALGLTLGALRRAGRGSRATTSRGPQRREPTETLPALWCSIRE